MVKMKTIIYFSFLMFLNIKYSVTNNFQLHSSHSCIQLYALDISFAYLSVSWFRTPSFSFDTWLQSGSRENQNMLKTLNCTAGYTNNITWEQLLSSFVACSTYITYIYTAFRKVVYIYKRRFIAFMECILVWRSYSMVLTTLQWPQNLFNFGMTF